MKVFVILSFLSVAFAASYGGNSKFQLPETVLKTQNYEESQDVVELIPEIVKEDVYLNAHVPEFDFKQVSVEDELQVPTVSFKEQVKEGELKVPTVSFQAQDSYVDHIIPKVGFTKAKTTSSQYVPNVEYEDVQLTRYQLVPRVVYDDVKLQSFRHIPKLAYETRTFSAPRFGIQYAPQDRSVEYEVEEFWPEVVANTPPSKTY